MTQYRSMVRLALMTATSAALMGSAPPAWSQNIGASPLTTLHQQLQLSPAQEIAWKAYRAEASAPTATQDRRRAAATMFPHLSSPQRMDLVEAEMKQELLDLERQSQALKAFYATLSPGQKSLFDARTLPQQQSSQ